MRELLAFVDSLPWSEVAHAYGDSHDAPKELRRLLSDDEDERFDAICGFLLGAIVHQHTIYPATPLVMQSVIKILECGRVNVWSSGFGDSMASQLLSFLSQCMQSGQGSMCGNPHPYFPTVESIVEQKVALFHAFAKHEDVEVRAEAQLLLKWC